MVGGVALVFITTGNVANFDLINGNALGVGGYHAQAQGQTQRKQQAYKLLHDEHFLLKSVIVR